MLPHIEVIYPDDPRYKPLIEAYNITEAKPVTLVIMDLDEYITTIDNIGASETFLVHAVADRLTIFKYHEKVAALYAQFKAPIEGFLTLKVRETPT